MREVFEYCNKQFAKCLVPDDCISLDETLYSMRNQVSFKQYDSSKPAQYGMLFKFLNYDRYSYTQTHVYCGKPQGNPTEHVCGTINYVKYLVDKLSSVHSLGGRNITMDRLYTSFELAEWLLNKAITLVGTMLSNRVGIPPEVKYLDNWEALSSETYWETNGKKVITSYVVKTSIGKKT